jgi:hypothetical protein|tara:strand:- start:255 stop:536 length:282 start_codon:yes stop_codon:yes gene_type:complete
MIQYFKDVVETLQREGTIFGAEYRKKNGEVTKINGRFGVAKFVKGTGVSSPNVLTVWDNNRKRYTSLIPDNIVSINTNRKKYVKTNEFLIEQI